MGNYCAQYMPYGVPSQFSHYYIIIICICSTFLWRLFHRHSQDHLWHTEDDLALSFQAFRALRMECMRYEGGFVFVLFCFCFGHSEYPPVLWDTVALKEIFGFHHVLVLKTSVNILCEVRRLMPSLHRICIMTESKWPLDSYTTWVYTSLKHCPG